MAKPRKRLGEILVEEGVLSEFQVNAALSDQKKWGGKLGEHLIRLGFLNEEQMVNALRNQLKIPSVDLRKVKVPSEVVQQIPEDLIRKNGVLPVGIKEVNGKEYLIIAMADPSNLNAVDELQFATKMKIMPALCGPVTLEKALKYYLDGEGNLFEEEEGMFEQVERAQGNVMYSGRAIESAHHAQSEAGQNLPPLSPIRDEREPGGQDMAQIRAELSALRNLLIDKGVLDRRAFVEEVMNQKKQVK